jgi:hypothetical protein
MGTLLLVVVIVATPALLSAVAERGHISRIRARD